jgi:hypothetical protein
LTELLTQGFPDRSTEYWRRALENLAKRAAPAAYPRFGYMLERGDRAVGVVLMIFTLQGGGAQARCNISSWYVDPLYQCYASLLIAAAIRLKHVTYINVSPATHTRPAIEAQGFRRYSNGQMLCVPILSGRASKARAQRFCVGKGYGASLGKEEHDILLAHDSYGCLSFIVRENGHEHPFVFLPRRVLHGAVPALQLVYCRDVEDFLRFAGVLGEALARLGHFSVLVDANERLPGLVGVYRANCGPKYFKGPARPRIGDLTFCESILFGP